MVKFINKHNKIFAILTALWIIIFIFIPVSSASSLFNGILVNIKYLNNPDYNLWTQEFINNIIFISIDIVFLIATSILLMVFYKKNISFAIATFVPILVISIMFIHDLRFYNVSFGFYLAILIFAFFLFYYIADIIIHRKPKTAKTSKPKKPTTDERIAALEKEIEELKNKKDDE